jgi:hypothetical protein
MKSLFRPSKAFHEFKTSLAINKKGITTVTPLCIMEMRKRGVLVKSLEVAPLISDVFELKDLFFCGPEILDSDKPAAVKREIVTRFGRLTAKIFQNGIFQYDYSLNNFMLKKEAGIPKIYFIDFERVAIKNKLSWNQKLELIAKLNRVGREVSFKERLMFLKGYLEIDTDYHGDLKSLVSKVQKRTLDILRRDLKRGRLTSIYTHGKYEKFNIDGYRGIYRRDYKSDEIVRQAKKIQENLKYTRITLQSNASTHFLYAIQYPKQGATTIWSILYTLIMAGLSLNLPDALIEGENRSFLFLGTSEDDGLQSFDLIKKKTGSKVMKVLDEHFKEEIAKIDQLLTLLNAWDAKNA